VDLALQPPEIFRLMLRHIADEHIGEIKGGSVPPITHLLTSRRSGSRLHGAHRLRFSLIRAVVVHGSSLLVCPDRRIRPGCTHGSVEWRPMPNRVRSLTHPPANPSWRLAAANLWQPELAVSAVGRAQGRHTGARSKIAGEAWRVISGRARSPVREHGTSGRAGRSRCSAVAGLYRIAVIAKVQPPPIAWPRRTSGTPKPRSDRRASYSAGRLKWPTGSG
jgi:hypothetical protein